MEWLITVTAVSLSTAVRVSQGNLEVIGNTEPPPAGEEALIFWSIGELGGSSGLDG